MDHYSMCFFDHLAFYSEAVTGWVTTRGFNRRDAHVPLTELRSAATRHTRADSMLIIIGRQGW
jgi:hypothetical protein